MTQNLLYAESIPINEKINICVPKVGDILEDEDNYYGALSMVVSSPIDFMVQLDDAGIDFTTIDDYELFLLTFNGLKMMDTHLLFGNLDLSKFDYEEDEENNMIKLVDKENDIVIDKLIHLRIASVLRKVNHLEKDKRKPGNDEAKKYMIERARKKQSRKRKTESQLEMLIVAMVNTEQFKYDFSGTKDLSIYQFNESVRQVIKKVDYEHKMSGVYAGTIDPKTFSQDELNWLIHK